MHTVMDKTGAMPELDAGGSQQGVSPAPAVGAEQKRFAGTDVHGQPAQPSVNTGHTVLSGNSQSLQQGANEMPQPFSAQGTSQPVNGHQEFAGSQAGQTPPFVVKFPDNIPVSQELLDNYQAFCADCGLSNEQAQQAVDFYLKEQTRQMDVERELSMNILQNGVWKGQFEQRLAVANGAVRALDAQLGGRLKPMLEAGLGNSHVFAEMMACVGDLLQEENFIPHAGGSATTRSMSTEDFLRNEVFKTR